METLPMVAWDRRRYLFVPHPCRKKARRGPSMGLFRKSQMMVQSYEEYFIPPNKITNIFKLFFVLQRIAHSKAM